MKDGCNKLIAGTRGSIRMALLGDTSYAATDDDEVVIVCNEESDDVSISEHDTHVASYVMSELDEAITDFLSRVQGGAYEQKA